VQVIILTSAAIALSLGKIIASVSIEWDESRATVVELEEALYQLPYLSEGRLFRISKKFAEDPSFVLFSTDELSGSEDSAEF
jgi:hypothetical protein